MVSGVDLAGFHNDSITTHDKDDGLNESDTKENFPNTRGHSVTSRDQATQLMAVPSKV